MRAEESSKPISRRFGGKRLNLMVLGWTILVVAGGLLAWLVPAAPNFGCVEPGVLYRSGQPGAEALRVLRRQYGIRTIVNLRSSRKLKTDPLAREEIAFARESGMHFINLPYGDPSPEAQVERFLAIVGDSANHPVLVHCARGKERAGVMVAAYRTRKQRWSFSEALSEMESFGFEPEKKPEMLRCVQQLAQTAR